jgi:hypothetical protein
MRTAREDAARRLNRELERGIDQYNRQAHTMLDDRMRTLANESGRKMEARLDSVLEELRERGAKNWSALEKRVADLELELRARLETLGSEVESGRSVIDSSVRRLPRQADDVPEGST